MKLFINFILSFLFISCSTTKESLNEIKKNADKIHTELCLGQSTTLKEISGSIWVKIESKNGSGQFPANVLINEQSVIIEITDLLGGTQGVLSIENGKYSYEGRGGETSFVRQTLRSQLLAGLKASEFKALFFNKLPCSAEKVSSISIVSDDDSEVQFIGKNNHVDRFMIKKWGDRFLPEKFTKLGMNEKIVFNFSNFEDPHGLPKNVKVESNVGVIQLRWRDRKVVSLQLQ